ncbi:RAB6A-GEF complex partner protein 1-like isoform X1 [Arapaima gigas]
MYFLTGWPRKLRCPLRSGEEPFHIRPNSRGSFFAVLSDTQVGVWFGRPSVLIVSYTESAKAASRCGPYRLAEWKGDDTMLAIATASGHLLLFAVLRGRKEGFLYEPLYPKGTPHSQGPPGSKGERSVPALTLEQKDRVDLEAPITSLASVREQLAVSTADGRLHLLRWSDAAGSRTAVGLHAVPFAVDLRSCRGGPVSGFEHTHIRDMELCETLNGFAVVLDDGRLGFLSPATDFTRLQGVWAPSVTDGLCVAANNKYRLLAFGCASGSVLVYTIDGETGSMLLSHKLHLTPKHYPDMWNKTGAVKLVRWSPDCSVVVVSWTQGGLSLWSVFGGHLVCTLTEDFMYRSDGAKRDPLKITCVGWGAEGYHLWALTGMKAAQGVCGSPRRASILQFSFLRSSSAVSRDVNTQEHVFLVGEDRVYVARGDPPQVAPPATASPTFGALLGHRHWHVVQVCSSSPHA